MPALTIDRLHEALSDDLKKIGSDSVLNDATRKIFSTHINGAVFVFAHKQADPAYWNGVKHYGSGPTSRFRMHRTPVEPAAKAAPVKKPARRKAPAAE